MYEWKMDHNDHNGRHYWSRQYNGCDIIAVGLTPESTQQRQIQWYSLHGGLYQFAHIVHDGGDTEADRIASALSRLGAELWPQPMARDEQAAEAATGCYRCKRYPADAKRGGWMFAIVDCGTGATVARASTESAAWTTFFRRLRERPTKHARED